MLSVSPEARSQLDAFQPTSVLAGQELTKQLDVSLGETLRNQPGVAVRSLGGAPARPVVRGLDGDRVLILQDGQRTGDLSSQSSDHGVSVNPAAAQRIEVVRGPATLLYGANAIGGLVNVITDEIPSAPQRGAKGTVTFDAASAGTQAGTAADVHVGNGTLALHAGGGGRRSSNMDTPEGEVANSQSRSAFGNVGLAWTGEKGFFGGSYGYDDMKYGVPVVEDGTLQLTPRRHALTLRGGADRLDAPFESFRVSLAHRHYRHDELEGSEVGTAFHNDTTELQLMAGHRAAGRLKGSVGGWALDRTFEAVGAEALSPPVDQRGFAAFLYEEVTWPHVTLQFGGRLDHTNLSPDGEPARDFTNPSASLGLLVPAGRGQRSADRGGQPGARGALAGARGAVLLRRAPRQLRVRGGQPGSGARARARPGRVAALAHAPGVGRGDLLPQPASPTSSSRSRSPRRSSRRGRRSSRPASRDARSATKATDMARRSADLDFVEYVGADSVLQGVEAHTDVQITSRFVAEVGLDYVRGALSSDGDLPLPRIPPLRLRGGLRYQHNAFQAGAEVVGAADQERVFTERRANGRLRHLEAVRRLLVPGVWGHEHADGAARQRHQRAVSEPPVADKGRGAGDGAERADRLQPGDSRLAPSPGGWCTRDQRPKIRRCRRFDAQPCPRDRVGQLHAPGVQRLPGDDAAGRPVGPVADDRPAR